MVTVRRGITDREIEDLLQQHGLRVSDSRLYEIKSQGMIFEASYSQT